MFPVFWKPWPPTGINRSTLSKILNQKGYSTGTDALDRLCTCLGCGVADLVEHVPNDRANRCLSLTPSARLDWRV